jgi:hypothetical protein
VRVDAAGSNTSAPERLRNADLIAPLERTIDVTVRVGLVRCGELRLRALRPEARTALLAADEERVGRLDLDEGYWRSANAAADVHRPAFSVCIENLDNLRHLRCPLEDSLRDLIDGHQYFPVLRICLTSAIISFTSSIVIDH